MISNFSKNFIAFLCLSICYIQTASAVELNYPVTPLSSHYFTRDQFQAAVDSLTEAQFNSEGVPGEVFRERYPKFKDELISRLNPRIKARFIENDQNTSEASKSNGELMRSDYLGQIYFAIMDVMGSNANVFKPYKQYESISRILYFDSHVKLLQTGEVQVTENIKIFKPVLHDKSLHPIMHGIIRSFPTQYHDKIGFLHKAPWTVTSVLCDGSPESRLMNHKSGEDQLRIGAVLIKSGIHTYTITYTTNAEIRFYSDHDQLDWNVTGNGWDFGIDSASCEVELPAGAHVHTNACYTGPVGSKASDCTGYADRSGIYTFHTTKALGDNQGFTISLSFDKGAVIEPGFTARLTEFCHSNMVFVIAVITFLLYCFILWFMSNIYSQSSSVVIPEFAPPSGLFPAQVGFIDSREYSSNLLVSEIVYAAVRKVVSLTVTNNDGSITYTVNNLGTGNNTGDGFLTAIAAASPMQINKKLKLPELNSLNDILARSLSKDNVINNYFDDTSHTVRNLLTRIYTFITLLIIFYAGCVYFNWMTWVYFALLFVVIGMHFALMNAWKGYSNRGREIERKIKGFKMFLNTSEANRMNIMNPPALTPELYEAFLPYAIALGVENNWGKLFANILSDAVANGTFNSTIHYHGWSNNYGVNSYWYAHSTIWPGFYGGVAASVVTSSGGSGSSTGSAGGSYGGGGDGGSSGGGAAAVAVAAGSSTLEFTLFFLAYILTYTYKLFKFPTIE
jgi:uncharacterized membrane protein YgcG